MLLAEAVLGEMLPSTRRAWHRRWAEELTELNDSDLASVIARASHWHQAGDPEPALAAAIEAARISETVDAFGQAASHWTRAYEMWPAAGSPGSVAGATERDALIGWLSDKMWAGHYQEAEDDAAELHETPRVAADWLSQAATEITVDWVRTIQQQPPTFPKTDHELDALLERLWREPPSLIAAVTLHFLVHLNEIRRPEIRLPSWEVLERMAGEVDYRLSVVENYRHRGWLASEAGDSAGELAAYRQALDHAKSGTRTEQAYAAADVAFFLALTEQTGEAYALTSPLVRGGHLSAMASSVWLNLLGVHAWTSAETGRWDEATRIANQVIEKSRFAPHSAQALVTLVRLHCRRDQLERADTIAAAVLPASPTTPDEAAGLLFDVLWAPAHVRLEIAAHRGDPDTVRRYADLLWSHPRTPWREGLGRHTLLVTARALLGSDAPRSQDLESVQHARALMRAVTDETPAWSAELDALTGSLSDDASAGSWRQVVDRWTECGQPYDVAHARLQLARAVAPQATREAQEQLIDALRLAEELGAEWLVRQIRTTGQRLGLRGIVPRSSGHVASLGPLTAREREVGASRAGAHQRRDRRIALHVTKNSQRPRITHHRETRRSQPNRSSSSPAQQLRGGSSVGPTRPRPASSCRCSSANLTCLASPRNPRHPVPQQNRNTAEQPQDRGRTRRPPRSYGGRDMNITIFHPRRPAVALALVLACIAALWLTPATATADGSPHAPTRPISTEAGVYH
jgi:tetratricopeptide (TPR) repeat protein